MSYFYDDKGIIKEEILTTRAEDWAKSFSRRLNSAQLRKFYADVKALKSKVEARGFEHTRPLIKMLKSKVAYASRRGGGQQRVPVEFRNFLTEMVDNVETPDDFAAFCLTFEAVVGYFYGVGGR